MFNLPSLLVIDQDVKALQAIQAALLSEPLSLHLCDNLDSAKGVLSQRKVDLLMPNLILGKESSLNLLRQAKQANPEVVVILMTSAQPTLESAVEVLREGVYDYLLQPFDQATLKKTVHRGVEELRLRRENSYLRGLVSLYETSERVGSTIDQRKLFDLILDTALREFESDLATILIWDQETSQFKLGHFRERNPFSFEAPQVEMTGPTVIYLKPQIVSSPEEIAKVFPLNRTSRIASLITYPLFAKGRIIGILYLARHDAKRHFSSGELHSLSILAGKAAAAIENSRLYQQIEEAYLNTIDALANAVEARDVYTKGHTERVWYLAQTLARKLGWDEDRLAQVKMGSILHDIGKIGVPDRVLNKPFRLTAEEFEIMKKHPEMGVKILEGISFLEPALPYVLYHHERYDGQGYPTGLSGEEVPLQGRLMAVVDTFDAITSDRPYRKSLGYEKAIQELRDCSGTQFDPEIARVLIDAWEDGSIDRERLEIKSRQPELEPAGSFSAV